LLYTNYTGSVKLQTGLNNEGKFIKQAGKKIYMENRNVGYIIIGVSVLVLLNIFVFNSMVKSSGLYFCSASNCPYHSSFNSLIYLSYGIAGILFIVGLVLIFSKPSERVIIKRIREKPKKKELDTSGLKKEEKIVLDEVAKNRTIFQADLIDKTGFGKAKMTRILDRLEGLGFLERKRRGMTNVVVLKE